MLGGGSPPPTPLRGFAFGFSHGCKIRLTTVRNFSRGISLCTRHDLKKVSLVSSSICLKEILLRLPSTEQANQEAFLIEWVKQGHLTSASGCAAVFNWVKSALACCSVLCPNNAEGCQNNIAIAAYGCSVQSTQENFLTLDKKFSITLSVRCCVFSVSSSEQRNNTTHFS